MSSPIIRVLFQGRLLQTVPFDGDTLRIGRRKDNDIVINNLSVSRAHAELTREGDRVRLIDGGSENGCFVNGVRADQVDLGPDDELIIGKHQITVEYPDPPAEPATPPEAPGLDPQHATQLFPAGAEASETPDDFDDFPAVAGAADSEPLAPIAPPNDTGTGAAADAFMQELTSGAALAGDAPAAIGASDIELEFPESSDVAEADVAFPVASALGEAEPTGDEGGPEADIFDFTSLEAPEPAIAEENPASKPGHRQESAQPEPAVAHDLGTAPAEGSDEATVTVRRDGEPPRQILWERPVMVIGRTSGCDIVLADPKISRRHAELERTPTGFWVRDLESINFTFVNGEKITERQLHAGDVVSIEGFELTVSAEALEDAAPVEESDAAPELLVEVDTHPGLATLEAPEEEPAREVPAAAEMLAEVHDHDGVADDAADLLASLSRDVDPVDPPEPLEVHGADAEEETGFAMLAPSEPSLGESPEEEALVEPIALDNPALDFSFGAELVSSEPSFEAEIASPEPAEDPEDPPTLPPLAADDEAAEDDHDAISDGLSESFEELRQHAPLPPTAAPEEVFEEPGGELRDSSGIDSLFDGEDLDEKPEDAHVGSFGGFSSQISFQSDPGQTPMPEGRVRLELSLRMDALSPTLRRLIATAEEEDLRIPLDVKVHIER